MKQKALFLFALLCTIVQGAWATDVATEQELRIAVTNNADIRLTQNIVLSDYLGIENGITVTLELNGKTLSRSLAGLPKVDGHVIWVKQGGTLTVKDNTYYYDGTITGGNAVKGGGIYNDGTLYFLSGSIKDCAGSAGGGIYNNGTMSLSGGYIDECSAPFGGGIYNAAGCTLTISTGHYEIKHCNSSYGAGVMNYGTATIAGGYQGYIMLNTASISGGGVWNGENATLTITNGKIRFNNANQSGGGVWNGNNATLTINGGEINDNTANLYGGGGVWNGNDATLTITGGSIYNNKANQSGGGVWNGDNAMLTITGGNIYNNNANLYGGGLYNTNTLIMSGNPGINGNTVNSNAENLYLEQNKVIIVTGAFTEGANIGVTPYNKTNSVITSGYSTANPDKAPTSVFHSDIATLDILLNDGNEVVTQETWEQLRDAIVKDGSVTLTRDIVISHYLGIENGITATIDLNGHTLSRNSDTSSDMGSVIRVEEGGTLTVKDSSGDNSGKISGGKSTNGGGINNHGKLYFQGGTITGCSATNGGGIFNAPSTVDGTPATMMMTGGVIDGCSAQDCGGIYNYAGSTVTITGGEIKNCLSAQGGGGVVNYGTATISGGTITGNHATTRGGGVWNGASATLTMTGGTITGNQAELFGGGLYNNATLNMSGNPVITGNTGPDNRKDNVYLENGKVITVTDAFTEGAEVGVTPYNRTGGVVTSGYNVYNPETVPRYIFSSDIAGYNAVKNDDGEVLINIIGNWIDYRSESYSHEDGNTIYIESEAEFARLAWDINQGNNVNKTIILNKDLDMSAHDWTPIGTESHHFMSNFNGNGHTISWVYVNSTDSYKGLFGYVQGTYRNYNTQRIVYGCDYIKNFVLTNSDISGGDRTGGVVGYTINGMTLENVVCQADVTGGNQVGGIVGGAQGFDDQYVVTIRNCLLLSGTISGTGERAAIIGNIGTRVNRSNNYYVDPASNVGNSYDVRACPVSKTVSEDVTFSYQTSGGITYNNIDYRSVGNLSFKVTHDLTQAVVATVNGMEVVSSDGVYSFTIDPAIAESYAISVTTEPSPVTGSGTEEEPYLITDVAGWNHIADYLNGGQASDNFSGKHFRVATDDFTISKMMGSDSHPFMGTFDGDGKTVTLAFGSANNYLHQACAPFGCINYATIKNLVIEGNIYSREQYNGGLAVRTRGENHIRNCISSVSIHSNRNGDCSNGGFIGILDPMFYNKVYFDGCAFTGELQSTNRASNWGGFIGWREYSDETNHYTYAYFTDCLFAPTAINIATPGGSSSRTFCRSSDNFAVGAGYTRCYYTSTLQDNDGGGHVLSTATFPANIGAEGTDYGLIKAYARGLKYGDLYYLAPDNLSLADNTDNDIDAIDSYFANVTLSGRTLYKDGDWNTLTLPFNVDAFEGTPLAGATVMELDTEGTYDTNKTGYDSESGTLSLYFKDATSIEAGRPYLVKWNSALLITSSDDWNTFASSVNSGTTYAGKFVRLGADIDVTTMVGTSDHPFKGTFDGVGHTLNFTKNTSEQYCAPFRYVENATIANLHTTGTISTSAKFAAGIVADNKGTTTISNCSSNVNISSTVSGDGTHGGIVACTQENASNLTLNSCLFNGSITGENTHSCGGLVGWNYDIATLNNCLFRPTGITLASNENNATFCRGSNVTVTNSYYSEKLPGAPDQGTAIGSMSSEELQAALGSEWEIVDGNVVPKVTIINITNPVFRNVTISNEMPEVISDDHKVEFRGIYSPVVLEGGDTSNLFLSSANALYHPGLDKTINAFRAYFHVDLTGGAEVKHILLNLDDATGIDNVQGSEFKVQSSDWYDLSGRKLSGTPTTKGVYIHGGKKVMVK